MIINIIVKKYKQIGLVLSNRIVYAVMTKEEKKMTI